MCSAIIRSSFVAITHPVTRPPAPLRRGPPRVFAASSSSSPNHAASRQTRARIAAAFSPIPPVKTSASSPPRAAASEPSSRSDAVDEQVPDREPGARIRAPEQVAHVARDLGDPEQTGLFVEEMLEGACIHAVAIHEIEQDPGVDRAAARAHGQSVQRSETHRGRDALTAVQGRTCWRHCPGVR